MPEPTAEESAAQEAIEAEQAAAEAASAAEGGDEGDAEAAAAAEAALGDKGKQALDAMKLKWHNERARAKAAEDKLAAASKPKADDANDLETLRQQARDEARLEGLKDRVLDKIEAKAASRFKDTEDALLRLGKNVDDYISDGKIDLEAIEDALTDLLEKRPDFGVTQGEPKRFKGTADGGPKANAGNPQLSQADVKRLSAEGKHAEIEAARMAGRLNKILGIPTT